MFYTPTCVKPPPDRLEPSAFSATYPRPINEFTASPTKNCEWAGVRNDRARRHRAPCKLSAPARTRREYGNQARSTYGEMSRSSRFHIKASPLARALGSYLWPCETLEARCISARCHSPCARNHRPRNATSKAPTRKHKKHKTYVRPLVILSWWGSVMALPVRRRVEGRAGTSAADAIIESCVVTGRSRFTIRDGEAIINIFRVCDKALCNKWNALADTYSANEAATGTLIPKR